MPRGEKSKYTQPAIRPLYKADGRFVADRRTLGPDPVI